jgi:hypothetical protein
MTGHALFFVRSPAPFDLGAAASRSNADTRTVRPKNPGAADPMTRVAASLADSEPVHDQTAWRAYFCGPTGHQLVGEDPRDPEHLATSAGADESLFGYPGDPPRLVAQGRVPPGAPLFWLVRGRPSCLGLASRHLLGEDLDVSVRSIDADPLPVADQTSGLLDAHHGRQAVLACDDGAMRH